MTFPELIRDPIFDLPLKQKEDGYESFDRFIEKFLLDLSEKVDQLEGKYLEFDDMRVDLPHMKHAQRAVAEGLIHIIQEYCNGKPSKAYNKLDEMLKSSSEDLYSVMKREAYEKNENFYRMRIEEENFPLHAGDLFHIPFELRGNVVMQRYSIPGYPSLYLGRTLYVCWEELLRPKIDNFQVARLKNTKTIRFLDLTPPTRTKNVLNREMYKYFMAFPLVACCSVKVKNPEDIFKPEYIVPQLLLQWVHDNDDIDGIRYKSTHLDPQLYKQEGELANLVLPVRENKASGHCDQLKSMFEMTEVISWQLYEYALGGQAFRVGKEAGRKIDNKLPDLELIKGTKYPYSYSVLGKLEQYLDGMEARRI